MTYTSLRRVVVGGLTTAMLATAWAQDAQVDATEVRAQLEARKRDRAAEFDAQEQACTQVFAVTDCVREVNVRRRAVAALLRKEENALNEQERRQRERERLQSLEYKAQQRAKQARSLDTNIESEEDRLRRQQDKQAQHGPQSAPREVVETSAPPSIDAQTTKRNAASFAERQKAAEERRAARDKKLKEQGKVPADLPTPP